VFFSHAAVARRASCGDERARVWCASAHPFGEIGDLLFGELLSLWGHLKIVVRVANCSDEWTLVGFARDDHRAVVASVKESFARVEHEAALHFVGVATVAFVAILHEHGPYARLYEAQFAAPTDEESNAAGREPALVGAPPTTAEIVREALAEDAGDESGTL
jgi:hypothetical protein